MVCIWNNRVKQHHLHYPTRHKNGISISRIFKTSLHLYFLMSNLVFCSFTKSLTRFFFILLVFVFLLPSVIAFKLSSTDRSEFLDRKSNSAETPIALNIHY